MGTVAVQPERILRDLQDLWAQLAQDQTDSGGVLRACAMTLVVAAQDQADAERVRQTVGVLMHHHPSRAVVLYLRGGASPDNQALDAHVFAECWKPFGSGQQICSEGIEITAAHAGLADVACFLVPLRVPDLPVVLWCRGLGAFQPDRFDPLFPLADKLIFDSSGAPDADAALEYLRGLSRQLRPRRVADLHWTRLTGWREVLAHLFDDRAIAPQDVTSAKVTVGGPSVTTCARYFESWIRMALPAARVALEQTEGPASVRSVTLFTASDSLSITRGSDHSVEVSGCGRHYRSLLPSTSDEALMSEELGILGPDAVYDRVLGA
jgi:glucose-6-phosphate dehydrogenase assembly protein OpcA